MPYYPTIHGIPHDWKMSIMRGDSIQLRCILSSIFCRPKYDIHCHFPLGAMIMKKGMKASTYHQLSVEERYRLNEMYHRLVHGSDEEKMEPYFHMAVRSTHENALKMVKFFVKAGANIELPSDNHLTALDICQDQEIRKFLESHRNLRFL